jgi:hypothetical protein
LGSNKPDKILTGRAIIITSKRNLFLEESAWELQLTDLLLYQFGLCEVSAVEQENWPAYSSNTDFASS